MVKQPRLFPPEAVKTVKEHVAEGFQARQALRDGPRQKKREQYARRKTKALDSAAQYSFTPAAMEQAKASWNSQAREWVKECPNCKGQGNDTRMNANEFAKSANRIRQTAKAMHPADADPYANQRRVIQYHLNNAARLTEQIAEAMAEKERTK